MGADAWLLIGAVLVWTGIVLWDQLPRRASRRRKEAWRAAARRVGLTRIEESPDSLLGWAGPVHVLLSLGTADRPFTTEIAVGGPTLPAGLTVRSEQSVDVRARLAAREIEVGDDSFDAVAWVEGPPAVAHALLDRPTRRALEALCQGRLDLPGLSPLAASGRLENSILRLEVSRGAGAGRLAEVLERAVALGRLLVSAAGVPRRVADNLKHERVARVRLAGLSALVREYPDDPATREALLGAREDPEPEVRLRAGIALGPEGRDVLRAIAGSREIADDTTSKAVAALEADLTVEEATGLLRDALDGRHPATAEACMVALGRRGGTGAVEVLARVLAAGTGELGAAAARALAATRNPAAEAPLLRALAEGTPHVRLAAAQALGEVGTATSVGPLREAEAGESGLRRAARQSIAQIQARLTGAEPGQLSLAGGEAGALSLADSAAGSLSLADEGRAAGLAPSRPRSGEGAR